MDVLGLRRSRKVSPMPKVAIIGTGPSGLAAAKALAEHQIEPVVLEGALNIGGMWAGEGRGAWSSDMRTNLSHYSCAFSDFPWPPGSEVFPVRSEIIKYLTAYAAEFNLLKFIHFGARVTSVRAVGAHGWRLDMVYSGQQETEVFDDVIIATGFFSAPYTPEFEGLGQFRGEIRHAAQCDFGRRQSGRPHGQSGCWWWAPRSPAPRSPARSRPMPPW